MKWLARLRKRLAKTYVYSINDEDTLEERRRLRLSNGAIAAIIASAGLLLVGLTVFLVVGTPLREYTPGLADAERQAAQLRELARRASEMERTMAMKDSVIKSFTKITGGPGTAASADAAAPAEGEPAPQAARPAAAEPQPASFRPVADRAPARTPPEDFHFRKPMLDGYLTNGFAPQEGHYAIDLVSASGASIHAIADGYVIMADYTTETGHVIGIYHDNNFVSFYKHNRSILKEVGAFVKAGEAVAVIGNSGENSTGPHLHFELWHDGRPINPLTYIKYVKY